MSCLRLTEAMLKASTSLQCPIRQVSVSQTFAYHKKDLILRRNEYIKNPKEPEYTVQNPKPLDHGYPVGKAQRRPYKQPYIQPWATYREIPAHYREGVHKQHLVPKNKKVKIKKYKNIWEERPHYRSARQRLFNSAKGLLPYDKKIENITGKHTGPGVEGGSQLAQDLTALHLVQPTGYVDKRGNFKFVEEMVPEFVVPDLDDFKLKPYVSYRSTEINQSKFTARSLYNAFYAEEAKKRFQEETGEVPQLDIKPKESKESKLSKLSKWLPGKKAS